MTQTSSSAAARAGRFILLLLLITAVGDGWSENHPLQHQLILLPVTFCFLWISARFLFSDTLSAQQTNVFSVPKALVLTIFFELLAIGLFFYETRHFAPFGYRLQPAAITAAALVSLAALTVAARRAASITGWQIFFGSITAYFAGQLYSLRYFPLNYLRSDMLAVIVGANDALLHGRNPYANFQLGALTEGFPYPPGMMLAYTPFVAAHLDVRIGCILFLIATAALIVWAARPDARREVAALSALFVVCPFLQYRHDLYTEPHWLSLVAVFVLMQRRRFAWAAAAFGLSLALYQFSWILFPFFLLNALRRRGWGETFKLAAVSAATAFAIVGPFIKVAAAKMATTTVGQWNLITRAEAKPMNLAYWVTFVIRPAHLQKLQIVMLVAIFGFCFFKGRCATLADMLRWMCVSLTLFIMLNVLIDGYFYLMLLVPMLVFTCVANGWWADPKDPPSAPHSNPASV